MNTWTSLFSRAAIPLKLHCCNVLLVHKKVCQVISFHLALPVCSLWHSEPPNSPVHPMHRHLWYCTTLVWVLPHKDHSKWHGKEKRPRVTFFSLDLCVVPFSSQHTPPPLVHLFTHMFLLPLLCWWYLAVSVLPSRQNKRFQHGSQSAPVISQNAWWSPLQLSLTLRLNSWWSYPDLLFSTLASLNISLFFLKQSDLLDTYIACRVECGTQCWGT